MTLAVLTLLIASAWFSPVKAQDQDLQVWAPINLKVPLKPALEKTPLNDSPAYERLKLDTVFFTLDVQPRWDNRVSSLASIRNRMGFGFSPHPQWEVSGGYFFAPDFNGDDPTSYENRLWQQVKFTQQPTRWGQLSHRLLQEQRWFEANQGEVINRSRYKLSWVGPSLTEKGLKPVASQEVMANLNSTPLQPGGLVQTRSFIGLRHPLGENLAIQGGYQLVWSDEKDNLGPNEINHVILLKLEIRP